MGTLKVKTSGTYQNVPLPLHHHDDRYYTETEVNSLLAEKVTRLIHNGSSYPARPSGASYVEWVGPTQPTGAINGDTWVQTS